MPSQGEVGDLVRRLRPQRQSGAWEEGSTTAAANGAAGGSGGCCGGGCSCGRRWGDDWCRGCGGGGENCCPAGMYGGFISTSVSGVLQN